MRPPLPEGREDRERGGTQARAMIGAGGRSVGRRPGGMCDQCPVVLYLGPLGECLTARQRA